jgi:hypothetical protein
MSGKRRVVERAFFFGEKDTEYLILSTRESLPSIDRRVPRSVAPALSIVECFAADSTPGYEGDIASPADLTGIGIAVSKWLQTLEPTDQPRVLLDSTSMLRMYRDEETVFRFLHALIGYIRTKGGILFAVDDGESPASATLFDAIFEVRETPAGSEMRRVGEPTWMPLDDEETTSAATREKPMLISR